jgi:ketosteroid isomerase-like protein
MSPSLQFIRVLGVVVFASMSGRSVLAQAAPTPERALDTAVVLASARPEIEAANAAWLPGMKRHDAESIAAAYADSGLFVAADGTVIRGRAAVASMYTARFQRLRPIRAGGIVQEGLTVAGPTLIYEWGHGWLELEPGSAGGAAVRTGGTYLTVWQQAGDGHWHIARNLTF